MTPSQAIFHINTDNIARAKQLVRNDCRLTMQIIGKEVSLNRKSMWEILVDDLEMRSVCENGATDFLWRAKAAHNASQLYVKKEISTLDYPPYFSDLTPYDIWLFHRLKSVVKGTCFSSLDEIKKTVMRELKSL